MHNEGIIALKSANGVFRHLVPVEGNSKQYIEGKTKLKVDKNGATGHVEMKVTSSMLSFEDDEMEKLLDEIRECARVHLYQYRDELEKVTNSVRNGQLSIFDMIGKQRAMKVSSASGKKPPRAKRVVDDAVASA